MRSIVPVLVALAASVWLIGIGEQLIVRAVNLTVSDLPYMAVLSIAAIMAISVIATNIAEFVEGFFQTRMKK